MTDEMTTRPMLEALLEGQRAIASELAVLRPALIEWQERVEVKLDALAAKQDELAAKQDELAAKQDGLAAKQDGLAARQDQLDARVAALTREVRDWLDDYNRKIEMLNMRLLSFETWLSRIDDRLHDEIVARTR